MKNTCLFLVLVCLFSIQNVQAQQSPALRFVTEYLRGFGAMEHIRLAEEKAFQSPNVNMVATCSQSANQYRAEVALQISRMRSMSASPAWRNVLGQVVALDERKLGIYAEIAKACTALTASGSNNVSSLDVMAAVSRYNTRIDAVDRSLFQTSTDVFMTLLIPGSRRLAITDAEKQGLLRALKLDFGAELDEDQQTYLVNAASVVRDALRSHAPADAQ